MSTAAPELGTWAAGLRVARHRGRLFVGFGWLWAANAVFPLATGLVLKVVFDRVTGAAPAYASALSWLALLVAVEVGRGVMTWAAFAFWPHWWWGVGTLLRTNLLWSVVCAPGPPVDRLPASSGEALGRFRDDVDDVVMFVDIWVDVTGAVLMVAAAIAVMGTVNPLATVAVAGSLAGVLVANSRLGAWVERSHRSVRERGSSVTDLVADLFSGVLTLKTAGAEERALERFAARNAVRQRAAVGAQLAIDLMQSVAGAGTGLSVGIVLLVVAGAMRSGSFTVGDLALFTAFASALAAPPRWIGRLLGRRRAAGVALRRLARLMPGRRVEEAVQADARAGGGAPGPRPEPFRELRVRALTARHPSTGAGVFDVSLVVRAGEVTAVTGPVGAGKTTLLRALLGMLPLEAGSVEWNGRPLADPGRELAPPRTAYAGQLPRLVSASLEENVALGWPAGPERVLGALARAQFEVGAQTPPMTLATVIGPRGSRLSGGQSQRAAVARALLREPDLLVLDDVTSALDAETETRLWGELRASGVACLVATHRRAVLESADRVVVLEGGRVVASGTPAEVLEGRPGGRAQEPSAGS